MSAGCHISRTIKHITLWTFPEHSDTFPSRGDMVATRRGAMPNITKRFVDAARAGRWYDERLAGFGLYVGATGTKTYFFEYRPGHGRAVAKRRISIGRHGSPWTPDQAREKAHDLAVAVK